MKLNEAKLTEINVINKKQDYIPVLVKQKTIPHADKVKYLGMTLDA